MFGGVQFEGAVHHGGEAQDQGCEAAGHVTSTARKQRWMLVFLQGRPSLSVKAFWEQVTDTTGVRFPW